jgi:DNA-binding CsgD family transcriptional regulator
MQVNQAANIKRREKDIMKLVMSGKYQVQLTDERN